MDARPIDALTAELEAFAAAVAHDLRTPLSALAGEVELALRRERSPAAYREALARVAVATAELVDLTGDLALLGERTDRREVVGRTAPLGAMLAEVARRCGSPASDVATFESGGTDIAVAADEVLLTRALTLVVEHAIRHRCDGARVRLRAAPPDDIEARPRPVDLVIDAVPGGFWPHAWLSLPLAVAGPQPPRPLASWSLRLLTAERIVRDCGGSLEVAYRDDGAAVQIRLRCAEVG
jgi:signal transduction histidine kinase